MKKKLINIIILFSLLLSACSSAIPTDEEISTVIEESPVASAYLRDIRHRTEAQQTN